METTLDSPDQSWNRLRKTIADFQVAVFLGAGVSAANCMPNWRDFIGALGEWTPEQMQTFLKSDLSLESLCEIAKRRVGSERWSERVRSAIYKGFLGQVQDKSREIVGLSISDFSSKDEESRQRVRQFFQATNSVLWDIVASCGRLGADGVHERRDNIGALLTTNLDGLPQLCDRAAHTSRLIRTVERAATELDVDKIPIYQLHGYLLPHHVCYQGGRGEAADDLVLTEDDYLGRTDGPYAWANVTLHFVLREMPVIFIGCSMTDDLIRRALLRSGRERAACRAAERADEVACEVADRRHFAVMRREKNEEVNRIRNLGAATLGVWPLWVSDFRKDLPRRVRKAIQVQ